MQINFSDHESYHTVPLSSFTTTTAEQQLSEDRKKYLRSVAKVKSGQGAGKGALSSGAKNIYSRLVKQAVSALAHSENRAPPSRTFTVPVSSAFQHCVSAAPPFQRRVSAVPFSIVASCISSAFHHCISAAPLFQQRLRVSCQQRVSAMPFRVPVSIVCQQCLSECLSASLFQQRLEECPVSIVCQQCLSECLSATHFRVRLSECLSVTHFRVPVSIVCQQCLTALCVSSDLMSAVPYSIVYQQRFVFSLLLQLLSRSSRRSERRSRSCLQTVTQIP